MDEIKDSEAAPKTWTGAITAITLVTDDLDTTRAFYAKAFGVPVVYEDEACTVFQFQNTMINLLKPEAAGELLEPMEVASRVPGSRAVFTITVENVDEVCALLASRGVTLLNGPMDRPWGIRTASFVDPGGNVWEVAAPL